MGKKKQQRNWAVRQARWIPAALVLAGVLGAAKAQPNIAQVGPLTFGMDIAAAEKVLSKGEWKITYRIDTPSTTDIAATLNESVFFHVGFFEGKCYLLEKRVHANKAEVERVFEHFAAVLGETGEATQSSDGSLYFARWSKDRREISIMADQGKGDVYKLTYEEEDVLTSGDARRAQMDELESQPQVVDPITGKARILPTDPEDTPGDEEGTDSPGEDQGNTEGEEGKPPPPTKTKEKDPGPDSPEEQKSKDKPKRRPINPDEDQP